MVHIYRCVRKSSAPWSLGDHVAYAPFADKECVTVVSPTFVAQKFGTEMIPSVHRAVFGGSLSLICDRVDDNDVRILLATEGDHA